MSKILVVSYSRSGKTNEIGKAIAEQLDADFEEIIDKKNRKGLIGFIKSGRDAMKRKLTHIDEIKHDPTSYDLVIIGTPVWASKVSSATLTYCENYKKLFKKVAFFYTEGGSSETQVFPILKEICGKEPEATLKIFGKDFKNNTYKDKVNEFCNNIESSIDIK